MIEFASVEGSAPTQDGQFLKSNALNTRFSTPPVTGKECEAPKVAGAAQLNSQAWRHGIGHDIWAVSLTETNGTSKIYDPYLGCSACVLRDSAQGQPVVLPNSQILADDMARHMRAQVADFPTIGAYLDHKKRMVYPGVYELNAQSTLTPLGEIRPIEPEKDLDIYKMIDHLYCHNCIRRQAVDRCMKVEKLVGKQKALVDELWEVGHRCPVYAFLDNKRNVCLATDCFEMPTHDPHDSPFMSWLAKYGLAELMETYSEPTERGVVVPELGWALKRPTIYVVRIPPCGNTKSSCMIWKQNNDAQRLYGDLRKPKFGVDATSSPKK
eukprot:CAMPEP_0196594860 /NCGR_PEP_ID=MMETSP1081-20130531/79465_1 /TAXON_ID=36882 /ORGANISM="Pyramimonas amylifera, Strain CCMP720" /LENGTH=324 /DNA_ID=CAMNT_0041919235 /DNA_START=94 /DNA_END=1068 /DNA_ORIENTATION=+